MKQFEQDFCMRQFKPALIVVGVLVVIIVGWTLWRQCPGSFASPGPNPMHRGPMQGPGGGARMIAAKTPMGPPVDVKTKATHPYWGNCNKCHVTTGAGAPVSKVMQGPPITIAQKMTHKDWGNCMLCHQVLDGFQPNGTWVDKPAAGAPAQAAALDWLTAASLGLSVQPVTDAMVAKYKLVKEDALLVLDVAPGSLADKAGFAAGDEIVRVDKTLTANVAALEAAINGLKPGADVKCNIYRGKTSRNLIISLPANLAALTTPAVPKPAPPQPAAPQVSGALVVIAATTPDLTAQVSPQFESAPYYLLVDQARRSYRVEANPNAGVPGHGVATSQLMVNLGIGVAIAGNFTPEALTTLGSQRIVVYPGVTGGVQDILNAYQAGQLTPTRAVAVGGPAVQPGLPQAVAAPRRQAQALPGTSPQTLY
ncbi:PDZ domain-containing protein [Solidesulfovibrio magneticus]|uniref:Magnetosome protein MamP n=1 Tax=Solidesulfovibrio magneticus (strain ATCC 700980 / DSM 13731 / RS-1) TaxID=573370 RepID=C4XPQ1_SOLM1|nr:PDZ domain-containing protein [Solidesulfovibrio magneticus]BAH77601.1 hypothetical protein DMR_41100 [Solidesulfovibrio magneticus RS-1]